MPANADEAQQIARVVDRVSDRLPHLPRTEVESAVAAALREFENRPIREFVPVLVERMALRALRAGAGPNPPAGPRP